MIRQTNKERSGARLFLSATASDPGKALQEPKAIRASPSLFFVLLVGLLWLVHASSGSAAQDLASLPEIVTEKSPAASVAHFDAANKLYEEGKYSEAAEVYSRLLQTGQASAPVYFNLGNAYFKSGQLGRAIAAYRQSEKLAPRDPDIRANLSFARGQTQGPTLVTRSWHNWLNRLTLDEWALMAAGTLWVFFLLLAAAQFRPSLKSALRNAIFVFAAVSVLLCGLCGTTLYIDHAARIAVVIAPEAIVRHGPLEESQAAFTVYDGAELQILDSKDDWLMVSTDPRRTGWIRRDKLLLTPPNREMVTANRS